MVYIYSILQTAFESNMIHLFGGMIGDAQVDPDDPVDPIL